MHEDKRDLMKSLGFSEDDTLRHNNKAFCCDDVPAGFIGSLQAIVNPDSGVHYLWHTPDDTLSNQVCEVPLTADRHAAEAALGKHPLAGWWEEGQPRFLEMVDGKLIELETERYSPTSLFSRNGTLVCPETLRRKRVVVVGCGSVGSQVAMLLTRAGVTHFDLVDSDCVELHNLSRTFNRADLGMFKTQAVARCLRLINPEVEIRAFECPVENVDASFYEGLAAGETLLLGCGDNRTSDAYLCDLAQTLHLDFMSCGFWNNAVVSENFIYRSSSADHTYGCLLHDAIVEDARVRHTHHYTTAGSSTAVNAGLGCSVQMGVSISSQLALDMLLRNEEDYHPQILPALASQMLLFVNSNNPALAGEEVHQWASRPLYSLGCALSPQPNCSCHTVKEEG